MSGKFQVRQPFVIQGCLSKPKAIEYGQQVWQVLQADKTYIWKYLDRHASAESHQNHQNECAAYLDLIDQNFCCAFTMINQKGVVEWLAEDGDSQPSEELKSLDIQSDVLVLSHIETLSHLHSHLYPLQQKHALMTKIAMALKGLHDAGYVHADLKQEHIGLCADQIKILDFGQSQRIDAIQSHPSITATPAYMAPELFRGEGVSVQSDIYALGVIFYIILTGKKPFSASHYQAWAIAHCQSPVPLMSGMAHKYQNLIDMMLAKKKTSRLLDLNRLLNVLNLINFS